MRISTWIMLILLMTPLAWSLEECQNKIEPEGVPCRVTTTWAYPNSCNTYNATLFDEQGEALTSINLGDFGSSGFCNFTFNYSEKGSYIYNISSGDTGNILVEVNDMLLGLVIGVGIISALFFFFAFKLADEHTILKLFLLLAAMTNLLFIPLGVMFPNTIDTIFYNFYLGVFIFFWLYVFIYFFYWMYKRFISTVKK